MEQPFSVDGSIPDFALGPRFVLMMNIFTVVSENWDCLVSSLCHLSCVSFKGHGAGIWLSGSVLDS